MRRNLKATVMVAALLMVIGTMVWPTPKPALADPIYNVELDMDWNGFDPSNCLVQAQQLGWNLLPIGNAINLNPNQGFTVWTGNWQNGSSQTCYIRFTWVNGMGGENGWTDVGGGGGPYPPRIVALAYPNTTAATVQAH